MSEVKELFKRAAKPVAIRPAFHKGMSLQEMLYGKQNPTTGAFEYSDEEKAEILSFEVDAFKYAIDQTKAQIEMHKNYIKAHEWEIKMAEVREEKLKDLFVELFEKMKAAGIEKPTGEEFRVHLCNSEKVEITEEVFKNPTQEMFAAFPSFVKERKSYEWNKTALKEAIKAGTHKIRFAQVRPTRYPVFNHKS